jgi:hypothetical protein
VCDFFPFQIEADTYWCTAILIDRIQDYFTSDRTGLQRQLKALEELVTRIDKPLDEHLAKHGVSYVLPQCGVQRDALRLQFHHSHSVVSVSFFFSFRVRRYVQFAFRWMNCLLMREMPLGPIVRLWDAYLAETDGFGTLHLYTCAALMATFSDRIRATKDLSEMMMFILNLPTHEWTPRDVSMLLAEAYRLKFSFEDAQSHIVV